MGGAMASLTIDLPDGVMTALRRQPVERTAEPEDFVATAEEFVREMRLAAAAFWYSRYRLSQGMAAEVAGLPRAAFLDALAREKVEAVQITIEELKEEVEQDLRARGESHAAGLHIEGQAP